MRAVGRHLISLRDAIRGVPVVIAGVASATALGLVIALHPDRAYRQVLITVVVGLGLGAWMIAYRWGVAIPVRILALVIGADLGVLIFGFALVHEDWLGEIVLTAAVFVASVGAAAFWRTRPVQSLLRGNHRR